MNNFAQPQHSPPRPGLKWNDQTHRWIRDDDQDAIPASRDPQPGVTQQPPAPATAPPQPNIRGALEALGLDHAGLDDQALANLHAEIQKLHARALKPSPDQQAQMNRERVNLGTQDVMNAIELDKVDPGPQSLERAEKFVEELRNNYSDGEIIAIARASTGRGGRNVHQAINYIRTDLTAVTRLLETQRV